MTELDEVRPLPPRTRLVHIGPPKTGTTTLQAAFDRSRDALLAQGVRYAGRRRHSRGAVITALASEDRAADASSNALGEWRAIVSEIDSAREDRVLFSSERLAYASPDGIRRVVDELGGERVHVAVTLGPIARILPSQWQQGVQSGLVDSLDDWLRGVLADEATDDPRSVWYRHRFDRLLERWAAVVGPARITAIVADDRDRSMLLRAFERLLGLGDGTLELHRDLSKRSLTWAEVEAVRALNAEFAAAGLSRDLQQSVVELGAVFQMRLRDPNPDEPAIALPSWAEAQVARIAREVVAGIERTGVRVVGNLASLADEPAASRRAPEIEEPCVTPAAAGALAAGILAAMGALGGEPAVDNVPVRRLAGVVLRRVRRRIRSRAGRRLRGKASS